MSVNKILKQFNKMVKQLEDEATYQNKVAEIANEKANYELSRRDAARAESVRATSIKSKIENLIK